MTIPVAIALGSNRGDRTAALRQAVAGLSDALADLRVSGVYETKPIGSTDQPDYLNACCTGRTRLGPRELLKLLQDIERRAGRERPGPRWGPRTLDLDLLLYGDRVVDRPDLTIPHRRMHKRAFVLVPLAELAPSWLVPPSGGREAMRVEKLAREIDRAGIHRTDIEISE